MAKGTATSALEAARYLILLAASEDEPELLSPLRLQKLLYYVQGWHLAHNPGRPFFFEKVLAWPHGPVVEEVYHEFKSHGRKPIPEEEASDAGLSEEERGFVRDVWNTYRGYSATALTEMTHDEDPWKDARGTLAREAPSNREIVPDAMERYFASRLEH